MDKIRVPKIENVVCVKASITLIGTLHLTAHHLIFSYDDGKEPEMWVPYPLIALVTRLPQTLHGHCPLTFHCRTFETFTMYFGRDSDALDVFESVKELTVATSVTQLYAFYYRPNPPFSVNDGWSLYSVREEFGRMGVGSRTKAWRFTDINKDYTLCPTYPARLVVPTKISDTTLQYAAKYRSKSRIPVLAYLHWANFGSITRCSQPLVGFSQQRSIQDEKLVEAIFQSHWSPESRATNTPVYGATSTNLIMDARPTANAVANTAKGAGTENMDHYREGKKVYLGIDNIHAMRESLGKVAEALREADAMSISINEDLAGQVGGLSLLDRQALRRSGWLKHISNILEGTLLLVRNVHVNSSHVLIHCSDGWDRTAQLSSLSQLCLDPFYRTVRGFQILVEKDWLGFGHRFLDRCGHLSSEKFFVTPVENASGSTDTKQALAFLSSVQNRIISPHHIKETSPVFHQFLESVRQIQRQFPQRFEFNERFLHQLYYHLYSCQFGSFLFNCERERRVADGGPPPWEQTISVWDFFNSPAEAEKNLNPDYDPTLDDPSSRLPRADMGVLFPNPKDVRFWHELYGRSDEEMNGRVFLAQVREGDIEAVVSAEDAQEDPVSRVGTPSKVRLPPSPAASPLLSQSLSHSMAVGGSEPLAPSQPNASHAVWDSSLDLSSKIEPQNVRPSGLVSSSSISLRPPDNPVRPSSANSNYSNPPNRSRTTPIPDMFASNGVKSVWGKLSSNASAAFSAVQDAYDGVTRDFKGLSVSSDVGESELKTAELRSRDSIGPWVDSESPSRLASYASTIGPSSNPWASSQGGRTLTSLPFDNPWNSVRSPPSRQDNLTQELFGSSSQLPADPTIERPLPRRGNSSPVRVTDSPTLELPPSWIVTASSPPVSQSPPVPPSSNTDPLGVGLL